MYTEFIIIFILLGISIAVSIVNLVLVILMKRDNSSNRHTSNNGFSYQSNYTTYGMSHELQNPVTTNQSGVQNGQGATSVVFCRNCATQFDASMMRCPKCGTPR